MSEVFFVFLAPVTQCIYTAVSIMFAWDKTKLFQDAESFYSVHLSSLVLKLYFFFFAYLDGEQGNDHGQNLDLQSRSKANLNEL